MKMSPRQ